MTLTQINKAGLDEIALDHVFTIGASGTNHYTFQGEGLNGTVNDPTLYLTRGKTYRFENGTGAHPIRIQSTAGASGTAYNTGVTNNAGSGTVIVEVQHDAPDVLYYQCTSHPNMNGVLYITGALADGGVTTAKIADNAVTAAKIGNNSVDSNALQSLSVTANKIAAGEINNTHIGTGAINGDRLTDETVTLAKLEHGTSSNDGKFLRANNGADPSFESIPAGTTINNNAADRIITGEGGTTLNGESNLTFNGNQLAVTGTSTVVGQFNGASIPTVQVSQTTDSTDLQLRANSTGGLVRTASNTPLVFGTNQTERMRIDSSGKVGIGITNPLTALHVQQDWVNNVGSIGVEGSSNALVGYGFRSNGTYKAALIYRDGTAGNYIDLGTYNGNYPILFRPNATEKVRIDSDGLKFNGDTAAANALDDYEEGTYTVVVSGTGGWTASSSSESGRYVKIGNMCFVNIYYSASSMGGISESSYLRVNLPFTAANVGSTAGTLSCSYWNTGTNNISWLAGKVIANEGYCRFEYHNGNNNNTNTPTKLNFSSQLEFRGTIAYQTA